MQDLKIKWQNLLSENGKKNHIIFSIFLVTILPSWSIFDYFAVKNLFLEIFAFRFLSAALVGTLAILCQKGKVNYIFLGYVITLVAYVGVGAFLPLLSENKIQYWCVGYSTCFVTWSLFQTWRGIHHVINIIASFSIVTLLIILFSPLPFYIFIINGFLLTTSVAIVCSGLFYIRYSFMYKTFILTEEKIELQEALSKKEKQSIERDKLATIGSMSAGISHDFNNSLNILQQGIRALRSAVKENDKESVDEILASMVEIIRISSSLIDSIKGLQKIEDKVKIIDLKLLANTICSLFKGLTFENIAVTNSISDSISVEVEELSLYNAMANVIKNAIEASLAHGNKKIEISAKQNEDTIFIDISDFGKGIPEEIKSKMFEGSSTKKDGLGFGLKNSKDNLRKIGGDLEIINFKDPTTFRITLRTKNDLPR